MQTPNNKYLLLTWFLLTTLFVGTPSKANHISNIEEDSIINQLRTKVELSANDSVSLINALFDYGEHLDNEGKFDESIKVFERALQTAQNIEDDKHIADVANYLAQIYYMNGDIVTSCETYKLALKSAEKTGDFHNMAKISMNMASNYNYMGDFNTAVTYALNALELKESNNDYVRICYHYMAMANIFRSNENTAKWEEYVMKAYKMKDVEGCASIGDIAKIYNSLGSLANYQKDYAKAYQYFDTLFFISKEGDFKQGMSTALQNQSGIQSEYGDFEKALQMAIEAEKYFGSNNYEILYNNNLKADLYQKMGQPQKALQLAMHNINQDDLHYYADEKISCLQLLYEINFKLGKYNDAYQWNDSLRKTEKILRDESIKKAVDEMEMRYETAKKEAHIEVLTFENKLKTQRYRAASIIAIVLVILVLLILYILHINRKKAEYIKNDLQQKVLRAQMNPHYIFNVLGSIQYFMISSDAKKASRYLSQFASLIRSTLEFSAEEVITLDKELEMLKNYIELEQMRMPDKFNYTIELSNIIDPEFVKIPPMLIQPFIENAIKHGFRSLSHKGELLIKVSQVKNRIEFIIEDNGTGLIPCEVSDESHRSMAMEIFEKRRKLIKQKHKRDFDFEITNLHDINKNRSGVRVSLIIPVIFNLN